MNTLKNYAQILDALLYLRNMSNANRKLAAAYGICLFVRHQVGFSPEPLRAAFKALGYDRHYPVPAPWYCFWQTNEAAYYYREKWDGAYGQNRLRLLDETIGYLAQELSLLKIAETRAMFDKHCTATMRVDFRVE